jgi:lipopolysaccharide transport system ATP-binding protein
MYVRLAFAVAAHLEPEILILDEVLAVGDADFQKKCLLKMRDVSIKDGRTVLFVSHNLTAISQLCKNSVLLSNGKVLDVNETSTVINKYYQQHSVIQQINEVKFDGHLNKFIQFHEFLINGINPFTNELIIQPTQQIIFNIRIFAKETTPPIRITLAIFKDNVRLFSITDYDTFEAAAGFFSCVFTIEKNVLRAGIYQIGIGSRTEEDIWMWNDYICSFHITDAYEYLINQVDHGFLNSKNISTSKRIKS